MAFDFPASPTNGEIYTDTVTGISYTFDGEVWRSGTTAAAPDTFVLKAGDSMLGVLNLIDPDPVQPVQATHKKYVDRLIAEMSLYQGTWMVATNIPDLNVPPNAPLNGYSWVAQTVDPNVPELAPLTIPGIGGSMISALDTIKWSSATSQYEQIRGAVSISQMTIADTPPTGGFHGQCWWDSDSGKQYVFYIDPIRRRLLGADVGRRRHGVQRRADRRAAIRATVAHRWRGSGLGSDRGQCDHRQRYSTGQSRCRSAMVERDR